MAINPISLKRPLNNSPGGTEVGLASKSVGNFFTAILYNNEIYICGKSNIGSSSIHFKFVLSMKSENQRILCDIAHCAFEVISRLLSRDQLIARGLRSTETGSRQIYREECITVEMATELLERFPNHVEITLFTPPEEKRTGADWYWRFEKAGRAIHARVQAKRVQRTEFGQADDRGFVDLDLPQLAQLGNATRHVPELAGLQVWLATYARFDATPPCGKRDLKSCSSHGHRDVCADHGPSLWIADAREIRQSMPSRVPIREIIEKSLRLDCLLPCSDRSGEDDGPASKRFVLSGDLPTYQECLESIERDALLRKEFEGALRIIA